MSTTAHKPLSETTITALRAIAAAALATPDTYHQGYFLGGPGTEHERGCVAYQHLKLTRTARQFQNLLKKDSDFGPVHFGNFDQHPFFTAVKKDLKLNDEQAHCLMGGTEEFWPAKYHDRYENAKTAKGRARALANYIEFFIKTDGTCLTERERKLAAARAKQADADRDLQQLTAA